jgi:hypothetical protein
MGNAMTCCGKSDSDANNINTGTLQGLSSAERIRVIVKIQSIFRGFLARKRVKAIRESGGIRSMMNHNNYQGAPNYDNPEVQVKSLRSLIFNLENPITARAFQL